MKGTRSPSPTAARILDVAERLVQKRGFNGFSYADVAAELKITTASLHYHFAGKADLGAALVARYAARFMDAVHRLEGRSTDAGAQLRAYANLYAATLRERRLCLCGMLAAEYNTLPRPMRESVLRFFDENEAWLARVLEQGRSSGELKFQGAPLDAARMLIAGLEGAMLVSRPYGDLSRFQSAAEQLIDGLLSRHTLTGTPAAD